MPLTLFPSLITTTASADIVIGYNTDGTPKYGPDPGGATGPIATPENPGWVPAADGTPTPAQDNYTFIPGAEEKAKNEEPESISEISASEIQIGFNVDGTPKFAPAPQGATGPIATPENPGWVRNPDGTISAAEAAYTFLPNADEEIKNATLDELKVILENEIRTSSFKKIRKANKFRITSNLEISASSPTLKAVAVKRGLATKNIQFSFNEDGQLVMQASEKLKGYQVQIISDNKVLKKITL